MYYYMITYGESQVDEIYFGVTKEDVIDKARNMINSWPEYACLEDEEIIEHTELENTEFDLVKIRGELPSSDTTKAELIAIYQEHCGGY